MATLDDAFQSTFRESETLGVPSSGTHKVWKSDARALGGTIEQVINSLFALFVFGGAKAYTTKALMTADYASRPADSFAVVYADSTAANNDVYIRGSSAWVSLGLTLTASAVASLADHASRLSVLEASSSDLLQRRIPWLNTVAGTNVITAVTTPVLTTKSNFMALWFEPVAPNTDAVTINIDAAGAVPLLSTTGAALAAGDLVAGRTYLIMRRASGSYRVVSPFLGTDTPKTLAAAIIALSGGAVSPRDTLKKLSDALDGEVTTRGLNDAAIQASLSGEAAARTSADTAIDAKAQTALDRTAPLVDFPAEAQFRPGENPVLWTSTIEGEPKDKTPLSSSSVVVGDGKVIRIVGSGVVAPRYATRAETGRTYQARYAVRRRANSTDPSGDAVRLAVAYLDANKSRIGTQVVEDLDNPLVSAGRITRNKIFAFTAATGVDFVIPAGAFYAVAYAQVYGNTPTTDVEIVALEDLSNASIVTGDVSALTGRVAAVEGALPAKADVSALTAKADKSLAVTTTGPARVAISVPPPRIGVSLPPGAAS